MAPNAPKRNLLVFIFYVLVFAIGVSLLGVENTEFGF
jgi:hypothetical protein